MADPNITKVYLLNVPLENDYKHTLYFESADDQYSYFYGKRVSGCQFTDFSYQRKDGFIRVPLHFDTLVSKGVNYVMYQNTAYNSDRWFYAFITDMKYVNDERTDIYIETDVMQTWMNDIDVKASFIEREHCADDTIGLHTYPEGLETGEYTCESSETYPMSDNYGFVIGATIDLRDFSQSSMKPMCGGRYNGVYSGVQYYYFPNADKDVMTSPNDSSKTVRVGASAVKYILEAVAEKAGSDGIHTIFIAPDFMFANSLYEEVEWGSDYPIGMYLLKSDQDPRTLFWTPVENGVIEDYAPVNNNKLLCYPYRYMLVSNNAGGSAVYQYELFMDNKPDFEIKGAVTPGCSIRLVPVNYKNRSFHNEYGLTGAKYPICSWATDVYTNWLTQNSVNIGVNLAKGSLEVLGGLISVAATQGGTAGVSGAAIASGLTTITNTLMQKHQMSFTPPQAEGNLNSGDVTFSMGKLTFTAYNMCVRPEYAKIIDNYFTMFGYKTCLVKVPEVNHRPYFWYTKTIDVSIDGAIPNKDMQKIKDCYNNGITFWRATASIGDYSQDNSIN